ncbi:MFS transporter [Candidatus Aquiluna sp. UB-MaderosW2red]|uniref:MFS transporter n=1 Tax=Candidatus Aquiluna sp. UB-MaderosW2red TaxID=1855377 RepID=UPI003529FE84
MPVLLNAGFLQGAVYVVRPMVTYKAVDMGADPWLVGIVGATFALAPFIFAIQIGRWIDRGNAGRALFYGTLIALAASVGLIFVENITLLLLAMPVLGIGHLLVMSGGQTMTGNLSIDRNYEKNFGLLTFYASLGHAAGPFLGGLVADRGDLAVDVDSAFLLASLSFLVAAIVIWPLFETKRPVSGTKEKIPKGKVSEVFAIRSFGSAIFVSGSVTAVIDVMLVFLPLLGRELGFSVTQVGILLAVRAVASMMVRLVLEPISTRFGMRVTLNFGTVFTIVATVAIAITGNYLVMAVLMFIVGFASGIGQPLTMAWVSRISRPEIRGLAISIRLTSNRLGQVVLPALAGVLAASGAGTIFWLLAGMQGLSLVVTEKSLGKGKNGNTETDTEAE